MKLVISLFIYILISYKKKKELELKNIEFI